MSNTPDFLFLAILLILVLLFLLKWLKVFQHPLYDLLLFSVIAAIIGVLFVWNHFYWGLLPLGMGYLAILKYLWDTRFKNEE